MREERIVGVVAAMLRFSNLAYSDGKTSIDDAVEVAAKPELILTITEPLPRTKISVGPGGKARFDFKLYLELKNTHISGWDPEISVTYQVQISSIQGALGRGVWI